MTTNDSLLSNKLTEVIWSYLSQKHAAHAVLFYGALVQHLKLGAFEFLDARKKKP